MSTHFQTTNNNFRQTTSSFKANRESERSNSPARTNDITAREHQKNPALRRASVLINPSSTLKQADTAKVPTGAKARKSRRKNKRNFKFLESSVYSSKERKSETPQQLIEKYEERLTKLQLKS